MFSNLFRQIQKTANMVRRFLFLTYPFQSLNRTRNVEFHFQNCCFLIFPFHTCPFQGLICQKFYFEFSLFRFFLFQIVAFRECSFSEFTLSDVSLFKLLMFGIVLFSSSFRIVLFQMLPFQICQFSNVSCSELSCLQSLLFITVIFQIFLCQNCHFLESSVSAVSLSECSFSRFTFLR